LTEDKAVDAPAAKRAKIADAVTSKEPEATAEPEASKEPEATAEPEASKEPEATEVRSGEERGCGKKEGFDDDI
jgi:hypothetical protein